MDFLVCLASVKSLIDFEFLSSNYGNLLKLSCFRIAKSAFDLDLSLYFSSLDPVSTLKAVLLLFERARDLVC